MGDVERATELVYAMAKGKHDRGEDASDEIRVLRVLGQSESDIKAYLYEDPLMALANDLFPPRSDRKEDDGD